MTDGRGQSREASSSPGPVVLVVTAEDDRYAVARAEATRLASEGSGRMILYDWDAATVLGDPLPSNWSAEGAADDLPGELDEKDLEIAGRAPIAGQIAEARDAGVQATAWLPSEPGPEALVKYAREHGVSTIVVPQELETAGELERLTTAAADPAKGIRERADARVVLVPSDEADARRA
jgi:hypothetical protein